MEEKSKFNIKLTKEELAKIHAESESDNGNAELSFISGWDTCACTHDSIRTETIKEICVWFRAEAKSHVFEDFKIEYVIDAIEKKFLEGNGDE